MGIAVFLIVWVPVFKKKCLPAPPYVFCWNSPEHKNPCPRGHEIYNFGRPFLGHHYYIFGLSDQCLRVEKKIF